MMIYADQTQARFFLVPDGVALPPGELEISTLTGKAARVDAAAAAPYEVPEEVAKAHVQEKVALVQALVMEVAGQLQRIASGPLAEAPARLQAVLGALGVSPEQLAADRAGAADLIGEGLMGLSLARLKALSAG